MSEEATGDPMISSKPDPATAGEKEWLVALQRREPWAWERLQGRCLDRVFAYLLLHSPRREDAEDLTAEVFAAAVASIDRFRGDARIETWLIGIARRKLVDAARRRLRRPEVLAADLGEPPEDPPGVAAPDQCLAERERQEAVRRAVLQLPELQREALWLRCVHQLSLAETARVLRRSEDAIKGLLRRAKLTVLERLDDSQPSTRETSHVEPAISTAVHVTTGRK
ncbi:MAG TPA: sigma-70 family RNA polymerase sigma factor [Armatimonadota bacterium]|nr:sigma-70 family RNA polymerase sigma factor [Armatimonadota bacterium]